MDRKHFLNDLKSAAIYRFLMKNSTLIFCFSFEIFTVFQTEKIFQNIHSETRAILHILEEIFSRQKVSLL